MHANSVSEACCSVRDSVAIIVNLCYSIYRIDNLEKTHDLFLKVNIVSAMQSFFLEVESFLIFHIVPIIAGIVALALANKGKPVEKCLTWIFTADALQIIAYIGYFLLRRQITVGNIISVVFFIVWNIIVISSVIRRSRNKK